MGNVHFPEEDAQWPDEMRDTTTPRPSDPLPDRDGDLAP
jgi:hypothetical protein